MKDNEIQEFGQSGDFKFNVTNCAIGRPYPTESSAFPQMFVTGMDISQWTDSDPTTHAVVHLVMESCYPQKILTASTSIHMTEMESPSGSVAQIPSETPKERNTAAIIGGSVGGAAAVGGGAAAFFMLRRKFGGNKVTNNLESNFDVDADADDDSSDTNDDFVVSDSLSDDK
jgi:hypothetical protein